ncbi:uncharacterized protein [Amphiura filiformis]|uniref:uncharacterized protein n=1 Tax=Amphiura filiformis TaxID=82378 RepID=UPI003B210E7F
MPLISLILFSLFALEEATSSWPLTFTITSTDTGRNPPVFWAQLQVEDHELLPINICGGWEIEVTFNLDVEIISSPASNYKDVKSSSTVHYFENKDYDSVYVIESVGDKYINIQGETAELTTLTATAILQEYYHPPVAACDNGTTYTLTVPRWSGGSNLGGFSALVQVPVVEDINDGWEIEIRFSEPLEQFTLANVNINADSEYKVFTLSNCCHWNAVYAVGETIDLPITVQYDTDYCPDYCAELASEQISWTLPGTSPPLPNTQTSTCSPSRTQTLTVSPISGSTQDDSYFNLWQTIVIAVGPSAFAAILLSCILFIYFRVLKAKEKDEENETLEKKKLEPSEKNSDVVNMQDFHGIGPNRPIANNIKSSHISVPDIV